MKHRFLQYTHRRRVKDIQSKYYIRVQMHLNKILLYKIKEIKKKKQLNKLISKYFINYAYVQL